MPIIDLNDPARRFKVYGNLLDSETRSVLTLLDIAEKTVFYELIEVEIFENHKNIENVRNQEILTDA